MAFGKKDKGEAASEAEAAPVVVAEIEAEAEVEAVEASAPAEAVPEAEAAPAPEAAAPEAAAPAADALLNMFQSTQAEAEDISQLLDLAGDVAIDDLLEQLHTVAAALGIDTSTVSAYDDEEMLAA